MNKIEKCIYDLIKGVPWMKFLARNLYQSFFDLLPGKKEFFIGSISYKEDYFYGFHDTNPFSTDDTKLLSNHLNIDLKMPQKGDLLEIGYFDIQEGVLKKFHSIGISDSWNYHKGCRLQWIGDDILIFNTAIERKLVSKMVNINTKDETIINYPIDSVCMKNYIATSFSYERLERCMPGYGYVCKDDGYLDEFSPTNTGLFIIDLKTNERKLLVSISELVKNLKDKNFENGYWHFVTHSEFSKEGRYVSFLHRWIGKDIRKRWTRLIVYDLEQNEYIILPTTSWGVSHYVWNNKNQIIAYCSIDGIDCHVLFNIPSMKYTKIAEGIINSDGHQSFVNDGVFVTDTYPDKYRMSKLYEINVDNNDVKKLASVYSSKKYQTKTYYKHIACDLHPRVSYSRKYVCFDSPRTGKRAVYIMKIK